MTKLLEKVARAYRDGGPGEIGRRAYRKYVATNVRQSSTFVRYQVARERRRVDSLVAEFETEGLGTRLEKSHLTEYKTSDTLFVLASGGSINDISDRRWADIQRHDSIGLNRWPVHDFVPTYYVFELPGYPGMRETFYEMLDYRRDAYRDTPTIIKDLDRTAATVRDSGVESHVSGNLLLSPDSAFLEFESGEQPQRRLLQWLQSHGYFSPTEPISLLYRVRASISYILHLAAILGYETIVLCGVDMVNSKYFFMTPEYEQKGVPIPETTIDDYESKHPTNDPNTGARITLENLIYLMQDVVLRPSGINLYVENSISALHPQVPVYSYEKSE